MLDKIIKLISFVFFIAALFLIKKEVELVGVKKLVEIVQSTPFLLILTSLIITGINFVILSGYDLVGLSYIQKKLPYKKVLPMSSISFAISNLTGHIYASGGAIRYLFLKPLGFTKKEIFLLISFETLTVLLGLAFAFVLAVFLETIDNTLKSYHYLSLLYLSAFLIIMGFLFYFEEIIKKGRSIWIGKITLKAPSINQTYSGLLVGLSDFMTMFLIFYVFLDYFMDVSFIKVFIIFTTAMSLSYLSQVPAGIGVLESLFIILFPHSTQEKGTILAAFALYRVIYFILPFFMAIAYLGINKIHQNKLKKLKIHKYTKKQTH